MLTIPRPALSLQASHTFTEAPDKAEAGGVMMVEAVPGTWGCKNVAQVVAMWHLRHTVVMGAVEGFIRT